MQRKMKRLTEEEIKKILIDECRVIGGHRRALQAQLEERKDLSKDEKHMLQISVDDKLTQQIEIARLWEKLFNTDFSTAVHCLDSFYTNNKDNEK